MTISEELWVVCYGPHKCAWASIDYPYVCQHIHNSVEQPCKYRICPVIRINQPSQPYDIIKKRMIAEIITEKYPLTTYKDFYPPEITVSTGLTKTVNKTSGRIQYVKLKYEGKD